jgi:hypothetical protein
MINPGYPEHVALSLCIPVNQESHSIFQTICIIIIFIRNSCTVYVSCLALKTDGHLEPVVVIKSFGIPASRHFPVIFCTDSQIQRHMLWYDFFHQDKTERQSGTFPRHVDIGYPVFCPLVQSKELAFRLSVFGFHQKGSRAFLLSFPILPRSLLPHPCRMSKNFFFLLHYTKQPIPKTRQKGPQASDCGSSFFPLGGQGRAPLRVAPTTSRSKVRISIVPSVRIRRGESRVALQSRQIRPPPGKAKGPSLQHHLPPGRWSPSAVDR